MPFKETKFTGDAWWNGDKWSAFDHYLIEGFIVNKSEYEIVRIDLFVPQDLYLFLSK